MYYQGSSEIQTDGLQSVQTLYLMNPNYFGYSAATQQRPPANMLLLNSPTTTATTVHTLDSNTVLPPQAQQFVGIPLSHNEYPTRPLSALGHQEEIQTSHHNTIPRFHYHSWGSVDHRSTNGNQPDMSLQTPQGLSLSLSPHQNPGFNKSSSRLSDQDFLGKPSIGLMTSSKICSSLPMSTTVLNGVNSMQHIIMGSKYCKAAQQILYEVANVGNGINNDPPDQAGSKDKAKITQDSIISRMNSKTSSGGDQGSKSGGAGLTAAQRQEIQIKKAKLVTMLDEVEQRYRQYLHRMEMIVASFEQAAGTDSAKIYTQLAIRTISKQFRCLKDAISSQIKSLSKSLDEEGNNLGENFEGSRLKFVDHHLQQQSALQKLGVMQNNAWRHQRGLPERAVSVLRAWLFEHFLHPYPKDSDKHMMAKQTGLTRGQVSNWFINARVRLWKPMVEEMYLVEMKNQEQNSSDDQENTAKSDINKESGSKLITAHPQQNNPTTTPLQSKKHKQIMIKNQVINPYTGETQIPSSTTKVTTTSIQAGVEPRFIQLITSLNMEKGLPADKKITKKLRQDNSPDCSYLSDHTIKEGVLRVNNSEFNTTSSSSHHGIGFRTHGRFSASAEQLATKGFHGNNVCLTLALPRSESSQFSGHQQNLLSNPRNFEFGTRILETGTVENVSSIKGYQSSAASHANIAGYDQNILDFQNRSKPFPAQLLPDFLASQI